MVEHPLWRESGPEEMERQLDALEKYVMSKLHDRAFLAGADDVAVDAQLSRRMKLLRFVTVEHLCVAAQFHRQTWDAAQREVAKVNAYRTPRDKLVCLLNCCKRINGLLSHASAGSHGADEFLPVLIFVLVQAAPPRLHADA